MGKSSALFLPRLGFSKLSTDQIHKYFDMHQTYIRSLRPFQILPAITNLDIVRQEFFPDGTIIERTTREWTTSLTLENGATIRGAAVNGSSDQHIYLLVPRQHYAVAQAAIRERESRFRDSLPGLPSVILFDPPSTQDNLQVIEHLSS